MEKYILSKEHIPLIQKRIDELGKFPDFKAIALKTIIESLNQSVL